MVGIKVQVAIGLMVGGIFDEFQRMHNEFDVFRKHFEDENHRQHWSQ